MSVDILIHFLAVVVLLRLLLHFYFQKIKPNTEPREKKVVTTAPEPRGALPVIGHLHLLGGSAPVAITLGCIADKHGPIFSLRQGCYPALVVSGWEYVKECFGTNDANFATRPFMAVGKYIGYDHAAFAVAPYGPYWRDVRKIVTLELLTSHQLEKLRHVRESEVDLCIKHLHLMCTKKGNSQQRMAAAPVVISKCFEDLTFNIIVRMLAGKQFSAGGSGGDSEEGGFKEAIKKALYLGGVFVPSDAIPCLEWVDFGGYLKAMKQTAKEIDVVLGRWLEEHIRKGVVGTDDDGSHGDFIDVMLSVLDADTVVSGHNRDTIIKATTLILIMTGSESTAETLTWSLSLLLNNRQALKKAQQELDTHVGRDKWVQESDINNNLKYLQAIVKETLRLYPPGPLAGPHEALEDCHVGGYFVQKKTRLIVNLWKLQRDPRIWSEPDEFRPERFLTDHANVSFRGQQFEYAPFSAGRRMCPAVNFGLQVVHLALARLLHGFDITTPMDLPVDMTEGLGIALPKMHPLQVILTPRLPVKTYENI